MTIKRLLGTICTATLLLSLVSVAYGQQVFKVRVRNTSQDDLIVKLIHFSRNTTIPLRAGQKIIFDPARGTGFLAGDRVVAGFDDFREEVGGRLGHSNINTNFVDIVISANNVAFAINPNIQHDSGGVMLNLHGAQ